MKNINLRTNTDIIKNTWKECCLLYLEVSNRQIGSIPLKFTSKVVNSKKNIFKEIIPDTWELLSSLNVNSEDGSVISSKQWWRTTGEIDTFTFDVLDDVFKEYASDIYDYYEKNNRGYPYLSDHNYSSIDLLIWKEIFGVVSDVSLPPVANAIMEIISWKDRMGVDGCVFKKTK